MVGPRFIPRFDPHAAPLPEGVTERLHAFAQTWRPQTGSEEQLSQSFLNGLCDALGVARPYDDTHPAEDFGFEKKVYLGPTGPPSSIDLYKRGAFILEAKCGRNSPRDPGLQAEWEAVRVRVDEVVGDTPTEPARAAGRKLLETFRDRLVDLRVLDPACGTGNFLYVSYALVKSLEHEVLEALRELGGTQQSLSLAGHTVTPSHFMGLEIKPWAAEIAQLVLTLGHLQWELLHRGQSAVVDPVLSAERSIACRDALITWTTTVPRLGPDGAPLMRWDGLATALHPRTGKEVPDPTVQVPVVDYLGVAPATWPAADFIVGNPPFIGNKPMRERLGDPYVDAVRAAHPEVPDTVDFVVYWWHRAAEHARLGATRRFGLVTTNSLRQTQNRQVIAAQLGAEPPLRLVMAVPDQPWVDERGSADVRIAMTVGERSGRDRTSLARLGRVVVDSGDPERLELGWTRVPQIHADLTGGGADVSSAVPLRANAGLSFQGMNLVGKGFRVSAEEIRGLGFEVDALPPVIRPYLNARELMQVRQERWVIDAFGYTEPGLREAWPTVWQHLYDHVKPERDQNRDAQRKRDWWLFGRSNTKLRAALEGLPRYIATPRVSKHRVFTTLPIDTIPDCQVVAVTVAEPYLLGVLSSLLHTVWTLRTASRKGVGNDPSYDNTKCFGTFPFPGATPDQRAAIGAVAEELDAYRHGVQARHPDVTLTAMYNLVEKLRGAPEAPLTAKEQALHAKLATEVLIRLHAELDRAVLDAYGWPPELADEALLERLVALNEARSAEEAAGQVRWLRSPTTEDAGAVNGELAVSGRITAAAKVDKRDWPSDPLEQVLAVLDLLGANDRRLSADEVAACFHRARKDRVADIVARLTERRVVPA
jgi:hypothetical protein